MENKILNPIVSFETAKLASKIVTNVNTDFYYFHKQTIESQKQQYILLEKHDTASTKQNKIDYTGFVPAISQFKLKNWLRSKHNVRIEVYTEQNRSAFIIRAPDNQIGLKWKKQSPYQALEVAFREALAIVQN